MKILIAGKIGLSFGVILIILLLTSFISFTNMIRLQEDATRMSQTQAVLTKIEKIFDNLKDAQSGQRGYIITGTEDYLEPYDKGLAELSININDFRQLTFDNPEQQQQIIKLESMIKEELDLLDEAIKTRRNNGFDDAIAFVKTDIGKHTMDKIRVFISDIEDGENKLLMDYQLKSDRNTRNAKMSVILVTVASILIVIFLILYLNSNIARPIRKISGIADNVAIGDMTGEIKETDRKDEIGMLMKAFSRMILFLKEMTETANLISERNLNI